MKKEDIKKVKLNEINIKTLNMKTLMGLYFNYKEIINYLFFGALCTLVNFISYFLFAKILGIEEITSSGLSWFCAVLFAYITNKLFVFESKTTTKQAFFKEIASFFFARILSGILCDVGTFALMVKVFKINDIFSKILTQIMVIIVNYIFSKIFVFKRNEVKNEKN